MLVGSVAGGVAGLALQPYVKTLLYQVKPSDWHMLVTPILMIAAAFLMASVPAVARALRIDTAAMLRAE
jgi:ABC-type uncharacterized transport system permease subunit